MQHGFVGQQPGTRFSPYLFAQRKWRNLLYLPKVRDLPEKGLDLEIKAFTFGLNGLNPALGPLETGNDSQTLKRNFLAWAITGFSSDNTAPYVGYLLQFFHQHGGRQLQLFTKHLPDREVVGTGQLPFLLKVPALFLAGDSIQCEVKNLNRIQAATVIQVSLIGGEF